jgi:hypothetical protein
MDPSDPDLIIWNTTFTITSDKCAGYRLRHLLLSGRLLLKVGVE